jgi:peptide/nickel transport system substrate-binding protein
VPLAAVAVVAAACGTGGTSTTQLTLVPVTGGSLTVGIDQAPSGCNPNATAGANWASRLVLQAVLPSAFSVNAKGESTGNQSLVDQAELISTSPQTVVYTIDPRAVWSDGVPITAEDFRYAWEQQRGTDPVTGLPAAQEASGLGYRSIKSLTPSNHGKTVTVVFRSPFADWQMLFGDLVPAHVMAKVGWNPPCPRLDPSIDLSGGPYRIASVGDGRIALKVNHRWWGPAPLLTAVTVRVASGPAQLGQWLRRGTAQVVQPGAAEPAFVQQVTGDPRAYSELDISSTFVQLEFALAGPNTGSVVQREAIAHAVNRQSLVSSLTGWIDANVLPAQSHLYAQGQTGYALGPGIADATNPFVGSNQATTTTTTDPTPGSGAPFPTTDDLVTTARLLVLAGYTIAPDGRWLAPGGAPLVLRLAVDNADPWAVQAGGELADQLRRAGFGVALLAESTGSDAGAALGAGQADLAVLPFDASPYPSRAVAWYTPDLGPPGVNGSADWSNLDDPTVNSLLAHAAKELNPVKAQAIYAQADQQLWTDMVALPLFAEPAVLGWSVRTYGVIPNFHGPSLFGTVGTWQLRVPVTAATAATASTTTTTKG